MPPGLGLNRRLGHAILGAMQPAVWLVTTPNKGYNAVLTCLGSNLLINGMRNSDHRFEWCALLHPWSAGRQPGMLVLTDSLQVSGGRGAVWEDLLNPSPTCAWQDPAGVSAVGTGSGVPA